MFIIHIHTLQITTVEQLSFLFLFLFLMVIGGLLLQVL